MKEQKHTLRKSATERVNYIFRYIKDYSKKCRLVHRRMLNI